MRKLPFLIFCFFSFVTVFLYFSCEKSTAPWDDYVPPTNGGCDTCGSESERLYKLYPTPLAIKPSDIQGRMVKIPVFDSTYRDTITFSNGTKKDTVFHVASGFIDGTDLSGGDTAFVTRSFWMDTVEVTRADWARIMHDSTDTLPANWPRTGISWLEAVRYCNARTALEPGLTPYYSNTTDAYSVTINPTATGYRLPTEDEWEYAARGGIRNLKYPTDNGDFAVSSIKCNLILDTSKINFAYFNAEDSISIWMFPKTLFYKKQSTQGDIFDTLALNDIKSESVRYDSVYFKLQSATTTSYTFSYSVIRNIDTLINKLTYKIWLDTLVLGVKTQLQYDLPLDSDLVWRDYVQLLVYSSKQAPTQYDTLVKSWWISDYYKTDRKTWQIDTSVSNTIDLINNLDMKAWQDPDWKRVSAPRTYLDSTVYYHIRTLDPIRTGVDTFTILDTVITGHQLKGEYKWYALKNVGPDTSGYPSNPFRLYDMASSVSEWCWDGYTSSSRGFRVNFEPLSPAATHVRRGGDYTSDPSQFQSGSRSGLSPYSKGNLIGLRAVRNAN